MPHRPQTQHPWGTTTPLSTPGVTAPARCNERWPRGTHPGHVTLSPVTNRVVSVATVAGWPRAQGPGQAPGLCHCPRSHPLAQLHFLLVGRQRAVRGINFSAAVGKFIGLIKWHVSLRAPGAQPCRGDGAAVTAPHGVPTAVPPGRCQWPHRVGGRQVLGD